MCCATFLSFYVLGIPIAVYTAFWTDFGIYGLVLGLVVAGLIQILINGWVLLNSDLESIAADAVTSAREDRGVQMTAVSSALSALDTTIDLDGESSSSSEEDEEDESTKN